MNNDTMKAKDLRRQIREQLAKVGLWLAEGDLQNAYEAAETVQSLAFDLKSEVNIMQQVLEPAKAGR